MIKKIFKYLYVFFCCRCTSCILWEEIECGLVDDTNYKERREELKERF